jgi:hypothetical protein
MMQEAFVPSAVLRGCSATGVMARVESLRGRMSEAERQACPERSRRVEGLSPEGDTSRFESLLAEAFE